jgi:hypothetical protein
MSTKSIVPRLSAGIIAGAVIAVCLLSAVALFVLWKMWITFSLGSPLAADLIRLLVFALPISLLAGYAVAGLTIWERRHQHRYIDREYDVQLTLAQRSQGLPASITSLNYHDSHKDIPLALPPSVIEGEIIRNAPIPTFAQLLDQGLIGPNKPLILGYNADAGQALTGDWEKLYSCGVGGMTGSGKSWVVAFLAGQSAAAGARIILIDPHSGDEESLSNRLAGLSPSFMCDVASTPNAIENALKLASGKLDNRRAGKGGNWPILLICDEWTSMLRGKLGDVLTATALDFAEQGRKYGCFALLAAQGWQVDAAGAVRDRLASHYILRTRGDQFRYQTGLRSGSAPDDTLTLQIGQAYLLSTRGALQKVVIPQMTHADILRLGTLVDQPGRVASAFGFQAPTIPLPTITAEAVRKPFGSRQVEAASSTTQCTKPASSEAMRAAAFFRAKMSEKAIVKELRGVEGGRNYEAARDEVRQLIIEGLLSGDES